MLVTSIISTKGGVGKTTITANIGAFLADAGLRVLLIDLDIQPTLSSYYKLSQTADCGIYELIAFNEQNLDKLISKTNYPNLHLIFSNDDKGQLSSLLLHAPDGRFRLKNLLPMFEPHYDIILIDTQGARSVLLEMAIIASDHIISPVTPEILAAREFKRGTLQLFDDIAPYTRLGIVIPKIQMLINRVPTVSNQASLIQSVLHDSFGQQDNIHIIKTVIPAIEVYAKAAIASKPAHYLEYKKPYARVAPAAIDTICGLLCEIFPHWADQFEHMKGTIIHSSKKEN